MECPKCKSELEIFSRGNQEIYVCPLCLSVLIEDILAVKVLKYFCKKELLANIISSVLDDTLFENTKETLKASDNLACPKCKESTKNYDFDGKLKFFVNRCTECGAIWINQMQVPLVALSFLEKDNQDDIVFRENINSIYKMTAKKKAVKVRSLDEVIAPYAAIPLSLMGYAFPVGSNMLTKTSAYATKVLIGMCISIFVIGLFVPIMPSMSLIADKVSQNMQWYRIITYAFLHGGIAHLLGNMWFLWVFGKILEDNIGWKHYLLLFLISTAFSAALFISTVSDKTIPCVGASGAISGVMAAYLVLLPKVKIKFTIFWRLGTYIKSLLSRYKLNNNNWL